MQDFEGRRNITGCEHKFQAGDQTNVSFEWSPDRHLLSTQGGEDKSWEDIQREFPGRSTGSLQVRYSTRLKEKIIHHEKVVLSNLKVYTSSFRNLASGALPL